MKIRQLILLSIVLCMPHPVANAWSDKTWEDISDVGTYGLVATALVVPAAGEDWEGFRQSAYSIGSAAGVTLVGKALVDEDRPDDSDNDSFPSGHTANAFASATTLHRRYGWEVGFPAYAVATLTGVARERARKHYWWDVVAGAAIGSAAGWYFTDAFDSKVQLVPWVDSKGAGLSVSMRW
jgi:membrane-associated phospholipid phosphatase